MLEGLAAWVLNTYVGEYVENLNTAQLSIALLQGAVELENLPLKKDALKNLDIPIELKSGFIGKITLKIPLRRLRSEPWVISIERLYVVAGPLTNLQYDEEKDRQTEQENKQAMLDALESKWKIHRQSSQADSSSSWFSYGTSVATNILENIQLKVKDVHIRYEDDALNPSCPFACGLIIKNLSLQSTDSSWAPKFVSHSDTDMMFKLVDLSDFGMYCDTDVTMLGSMDASTLSDALQRDIFLTKNNQFQEHAYILQPITAQAKVTRQMTPLPLRSQSNPRISMELMLSEMSFSLATDQYQSLNSWTREFSRHGVRRKFRHFRPIFSVHENPKMWWNFAQQSHLKAIHERNMRLTTEFMVDKARLVCEYSKLYTIDLRGQILNLDEKARKVELEQVLEFEELKIVREAVYYKLKRLDLLVYSGLKSQSHTEAQGLPQEPPAGGGGGSLFQRWFPGWSGWSQPETDPDGQIRESGSLSDLSRSSSTSTLTSMTSTAVDFNAEDDVVTEAEIEQELQDVINDSSENSSFLRKDTVFARMKFLLKKGSFRLVENNVLHTGEHQSKPLVELQCSTISMEFESRPRTSAMKFLLAVESLLVENQSAKNSVFQYVICPQSKDPQSRKAFNLISQLSSSPSRGPVFKEIPSAQFFRLVYEKNPYSSFKYNLDINTQPIDIIYVPELLIKVKDIFSVPHAGLHRTTDSVTRWQFDKLKKQTQEELKNTLDQLLEDKASRWNINLDICAPKFIIPENVSDPNPQLVVFDLGNFHFHTINSRGEAAKNKSMKAEEAEESFQTPLSTPPNEAEDVEVRNTLKTGASGASPPNQNISMSTVFQDKLYEKYQMELAEMQVLVGRLHDNWKHAYAKGNSSMHIVDRFNISVKLERRLVVASDNQWPTAKISGKLPSLTFHLNEIKIQALKKCASKVSDTRTRGMTPSSSALIQSSTHLDAQHSDQASGNTENEDEISHTDTQEDNNLLALQFLINTLSLEVQSQGKPLIELQVTGVQADVHSKPVHTSLALTVHSLLIVDAMQTYGQDFELLVASHKNVILDSRSGSIRGSELNSPCSPLSPSSPVSPGSPSPDLTPSLSFTSFQSIQDAISNAFHSVLPQGGRQKAMSESTNIPIPGAGQHNSKALILLEYEIIKNEAVGGGSSSTQVLNLQFNSLDFIANQETLVEIVGFVNSTFPTESSERPSQAVFPDENQATQTVTKDVIHVNADFKRLNVMMLRLLQGEEHKVARKVATATMSLAKLQARLEDGWSVEGSLGGLHLLDVTPEAGFYQQVIRIGQFQEPDTTLNKSFDYSSSPPTFMFQTVQENIFQEKKNALNFSVSSKDASTDSRDDSILKPKQDNIIETQIDMASVCYVHCPKFLDELVDCVSDFKEYVSKVASSIKSAATEVAMVMVGDDDSSMATGYSMRRDQSLGDITTTVLLEESNLNTSITPADGMKCNVLVNARMETPILLIPRTPNSPQILLAHLGEIVMDNSRMLNSVASARSGQTQELINLSLTNMNLYSLQLSHQLTPIDYLESSRLSELTDKIGVPILYDTSIELAIGKRKTEIPFVNPEVSLGFDTIATRLAMTSPRRLSSIEDTRDFSLEETLEKHVSRILEVKAKISSPLKLGLSKEVYEQILETTDNLTYDSDTGTAHSPRAASPAEILIQQTLTDKSLPSQMESSEPGLSSGTPEKKQELSDFLAKHVQFEVPLFEVELRGDFGEGEQGLVDLKLYDFSVQFEKNEPATTRINLHLKSLQMDDLLEPEDSEHRQIIVSRPSQSRENLQRLHSQTKQMMSTSCPDSTIVAPVPQMPPSLPSSFSDKQSIHKQKDTPRAHDKDRSFNTRVPNSGQRRRAAESPESCPCTPPPSPLATDLQQTSVRQRTDDLVHIDVTLVDKKRPEYYLNYNKTNRLINIDFACLDATINLQTWVVLLDFLGLGAKVHEFDSSFPVHSANKAANDTNSGDAREQVNSDINFQVESFTLIFNKPDYELARATAANLATHIVLRDGNMSACGQLGSLSLFDQSPHGQLYSQRFVSTGRQVVEFDFFKFGSPDFMLQREYDMSLKLRMSSVRYLHTNRFQQELVAFIQHFLQLQDVLGRQRAATAGKKINTTATRGARIQLDIEAASPILLIPHSSQTVAVLVVDLGNLKLNNLFIVDGESGTLRAASEKKKAELRKTLSASSTANARQKGVFTRGMTESQLNESYPPTRPVDPMTQSLYGSIDRDMRLDGHDTLDSLGTSPNQKKSFSRRTSDSLLMSMSKDEDLYMCLLDVISLTLSDMDLFTAKRVNKSDYKLGDLSRDMEFSNFIIQREHGPLLKEKCLLELHIEHNLEGDVSHSAPDFCVNGKLSSVDCRLDGEQYQLVRGILNHNLGEKLEEFQRPLMTHLKDPKMETVLTGEPWKGINLTVDLRNVTVELLHRHASSLGSSELSLGRLDFIRSQLSFSSYSNEKREVDLVSNEILLYDTRFKNEPVNSRPNVFTSILQPSPSSKEHKGLQVEMHLRSAPDSTHFTVLLNNMRLMCVFDWLLAMQEFISKEPPDPFIKMTPLAPEVKVSDVAESENSQASRNTSPLTVSRGIVTRRGPMLEEVKVPFELVLNFADTQFVVVEDSKSLDTNAVILKNTAVIIYKPQAQDKILTCSLQSVELFSCCLMAEDDTALSILDPTSISVELNANPLPQPGTQTSGLLDLKDAQRKQLVLEVNVKLVNIRLSYHDMTMFLAILNSLPQQAKQAMQASTSSASSTNSTSSNTNSDKPTPTGAVASRTQRSAVVKDNLTKSMIPGIPLPCGSRKLDIEEEVEQLMELGYTENDVRKALAVSGWNVDRALTWLTQHSAVTLPTEPNKLSEFLLTAVELNADCITLCVIDDCGDADIPLAEISCQNLSVKQELEPSVEGKASFQLMADYYNRCLSGWEPLLEPWKCLMEWKQYLKPKKKIALSVAASDVLNLNLTSTLLDLYRETRGSWTADYLNSQSKSASQRRSPFIPYVIRNNTGSSLWFLTATTTPSNLSGEGGSLQSDKAYIQASEWKRVSPGESKPFHFHRREKLRHQKSHAMHVNQLLVTVEGWQRLSPVSVDKVGVYFRHADPELKAPPSVSPARIVFEVKQEGSAKKLITVRSALVISNELDSPLELKLESTDESGQYRCITIPQGQVIPIPLSCINMRMRARPADWPVHFCTKPLDWQHVKETGQKPDGIRTCDVMGEGVGVYRFFVCVHRQSFPLEVSLGAGHRGMQPSLPGHVLSLLPPLTICNLLPLELHFYLRGTGVSGNLKAGKEASLHAVDISQNFSLGVHLENFSTCKELTVPPGTDNTRVYLRIYDNDNRLLKLSISINLCKGGAVRIHISAPFWLVNKSGLPLVFRQDGSKFLAAGQFEEHEQARSVTPLLFSFSEAEEFNLCQMRIGTSVHGSNSRPQWSGRFSLEGGISKRALHVIQNTGNRPDWVYTIGIQVTPGRGRYRGTNMVTFAPRFELDNQSSHKLAIAQQHLAKKQGANQTDHLVALPHCKLPFHWSRVDLDQLLCVKLMDVQHCYWSGGFYIDRIDSFHINMRDVMGKCHLLKVEVVQQGATFFIVFANADVMPPPFRIDNLSDVPVLYYQTSTCDEKLKTFIKPQTSIPYAWDEPTAKPLKLTLSILGGTSGSYSLDKLEEGEQLHYENFIYLAATATFDRNWSGTTTDLVLDCVHSNCIVFKKKEKSKRGQLWRMTGAGMLEHEGSMAPRDPRNPTATAEPGLVLDIADLAPRPGQCVPLILRKPDNRRKSTQTWRFTEQGQLCCHAGFMCVQAVGGIKALQDGAIAVLGPGPNPLPGQSGNTSNSPTSGYSNPSESAAAPAPAHTLISRQKLRPGSGCVSVRTTMDGPIRVVELVDIQQRRWRSLRERTEASQLSILWVQKQVVKRITMEKDLQDWEVYDELKGQKGKGQLPKNKNSVMCIELSITLKDGIGVSLVNKQSEELLYLTLRNISLEVISKPSAITLDASVAHVQIDNQLWGTQRPVILFVTPVTRRDVPDNTPALHISAHKVPSAKWNAEIFKHLFVSTKRISVQLEEQCLWKLMQFAGFGKDEKSLDGISEGYDTHRALSAVTSIQSTRYYFGTVKLSVSRVTLSMVTSSKLSPSLKAIKNALSMRLIAFEQANIDMHAFERYHLFETGPFLVNEIMNHYTEELKGQAARILGSVDFLGNPLGLVHDITEGIAGLMKDGNVSGLLKNVTHGFSNSTAKVASSLSDGISTVGLDEEHNLRREELRNVAGASSSDHLMAGIKGLGHGIVGGMTSFVSQSYSGAQNEGIGGFIKGMGKGVIGTVTKPVSGVLDLTSGLANALRDSSSRSSSRGPGGIRTPRCTAGPGGLLTIYSKIQAQAQTILYELNGNDYSEYLVALEQLTSDLSGSEGNMHVLISSRQVCFLNHRKGFAENVVLQISHSDILNVNAIANEGRHYVELTRKTSTETASTSLNKPRVRCERASIAQKVTQEIKYAKNMHDERAQTLEDSMIVDTDW